MSKAAIISVLKGELKKNKGNYLEPGIQHILALIKNEDNNEDKKEKTKVSQSDEDFRELLGKDIWVKDDYFCKHNILYMGVASYSDKKGGTYSFTANKRVNKKHMNSSPSSKKRLECIFKKEDIPTIFHHHLNNWINNYSDGNLCLDFSNIESCYGKTCLFLSYDEEDGYFCLEKGIIEKGTMVYPLKISTNGMNYSFKEEEIPKEEFDFCSWSNGRKCRIFSFCEEDYKEIILLLERLYESLN